ncbi:NADP-dependent oxidoreductase domain-containing protein [Xylariomycetidae sp. FL2044]|nr:NADP-dependent oxidoreductase domain-containing protein [Xylariomycetidae sp. FL2044]
MGYKILGKEVGSIGYGLMGMTWHPVREISEDEKFELLRTALEAGANLWNGGELYGSSLQENSLPLLKSYFDKYPEDAGKVVISIKGGVDNPGGPFRVDNSPEFTRQSIENCLNLIGDKAKIDLWEMARRVSQDDYLESLRVIETFVKEGKIGGVSLSEVNANTVKQAVKIVKVIGVEIELSLYDTHELTSGVLDACFENDITVFAYSPLGRGFLTGLIQRDEDATGQRAMPRLQGENLKANLRLKDQVTAWAAKKNCTPAQFAINWVITLSRRPGMPKIIPIPGSITPSRVQENCQEVYLTDEDMDEVDAFLKAFRMSGARKSALSDALLDKTTTSKI